MKVLVKTKVTTGSLKIDLSTNWKKPLLIGNQSVGVIHGATRVKGFDKGSAIRTLLQALNVRKEDAIAFGDGTIDILMFKACGTSVAMGNTKNEVKKEASYVTDDVDHDGLYNSFVHFYLI